MSCTFPEFLDSVKNKNVSVVGVGISNTPVISLLAKAGANVCAYDKNSEQDLGDIAHELRNIGVKLVCGENYLDNLSGDIIIKTPGMRYDNPALVDGAIMCSVIRCVLDLFFECFRFIIIGFSG